MKFSTISQDDEHLSWGRIKKEKEERVARGAGARADVLSTQSTREPDVVNGMRESMRSGLQVRGCVSCEGTIKCWMLMDNKSR
jgi:hypothetical protein